MDFLQRGHIRFGSEAYFSNRWPIPHPLWSIDNWELSQALLNEMFI
jgi:hypothetical protein